MKIRGVYALQMLTAVIKYTLPWIANLPKRDLVVPLTNALFQACLAKQNTLSQYSHGP